MHRQHFLFNGCTFLSVPIQHSLHLPLASRPEALGTSIIFKELFRSLISHDELEVEPIPGNGRKGLRQQGHISSIS